MKEDILPILKRSYSLVNYNLLDEVSKEVVLQCLEEQSLGPFWDQNYYNHEKWDSAFYVIEKIGSEIYEQDEWDRLTLSEHSHEHNELIEEVISRDDGGGEYKLWCGTKLNGRIEMLSNYDCWVPPYDAGALYPKEDYLDALMSALSLNPQLVKEEAIKHNMDCNGRWYNIKSREGKEIVNYCDFIEVLKNSCCYGHWCFFGSLDMGYLWDNDMDIKNARIPSGTICTMFNSWNGGGSISIKTIRAVDLTELNKRAQNREGYSGWVLKLDEKFPGLGYSSSEVYGEPLSDKTLFRCKLSCE